MHGIHKGRAQGESAEGKAQGMSRKGLSGGQRAQERAQEGSTAQCPFAVQKNNGQAKGKKRQKQKFRKLTEDMSVRR